MSEDPLNPLIDECTEGLSVALPELLDMSIGQSVVFMVGRQDVMFVVVGHAKGETQLSRVRQERKKNV